jgi:hypothetical protein
MYSCMTAAAFRAALSCLGLSHYQAAVFLGKNNTRLIRDWAPDRKLIPQPIAARLMWRLVLVRGPLFEMEAPSAAMTACDVASGLAIGTHAAEPAGSMGDMVRRLEGRRSKMGIEGLAVSGESF